MSRSLVSIASQSKHCLRMIAFLRLDFLTLEIQTAWGRGPMLNHALPAREFLLKSAGRIFINSAPNGTMGGERLSAHMLQYVTEQTCFSPSDPRVFKSLSVSILYLFL